jgi:hypothetical protein
LLCSNLASRNGRHLEHFRGFFDAQPAKKAHFDDLLLASINLGERFHGVVEGDEIPRPPPTGNSDFFQGNVLNARAAFQVMPPRVFHENAPNELRGNGKKVCTILPLHPFVVDKPHVGFVDEVGGLQAVTVALSLHVTPGQAMQLFVNNGSQPFERGLIPFTPSLQQHSYIARSGYIGLWLVWHGNWAEL